MAIVTLSMTLLWFFLASGSSAPGRTEHKGGRASWILVTLGVPSVQGHQLPQPQELFESFSSLCEGRSVMSDSLRPHGLYSPWNSPC